MASGRAHAKVQGSRAVDGPLSHVMQASRRGAPHRRAVEPSSDREMTIHTALTETLGLRVPLVMGGMQWVGTPRLAAAVSNAGALGMVTALTQPTPEALREALKEAKSQLDPSVVNRSKYGSLGVNITLLPAIVPPDYRAYARAALEEGIRIFETAGNNRGYGI